MDTENEILYLGIIVGWLFTSLVVAMVGVIAGVSQMILLLMIFIGAGILFGLFLIAEIAFFFTRYKIVRRE